MHLLTGLLLLLHAGAPLGPFPVFCAAGVIQTDRQEPAGDDPKDVVVNYNTSKFV